MFCLVPVVSDLPVRFARARTVLRLACASFALVAGVTAAAAQAPLKPAIAAKPPPPQCHDRAALELGVVVRNIQQRGADALDVLDGYFARHGIVAVPRDEKKQPVERKLAIAAMSGCFAAIATGQARASGVLVVIDGRTNTVALMDDDIGATLDSVEALDRPAPDGTHFFRIVFEQNWGEGFQAHRQKVYAIGNATPAANVFRGAARDFITSPDIKARGINVIFFSTAPSALIEDGKYFLEFRLKASFEPQRPEMLLGQSRYIWESGKKEFDHADGNKVSGEKTLADRYLAAVLAQIPKKR